MNDLGKYFNGSCFEKIIKPYSIKITGSLTDVRFKSASHILNPNEYSIAWITKPFYEKHKQFINGKINLIVLDFDVSELVDINFACALECENPRLIFSLIVNATICNEKKSGIHSSAVIHPNAEIHPSAYIGPNSYIGQSSIGEGTVLHGNIFVHDGVSIGKNCSIDANTVIGADGFGHVKDINNDWVKFPHLGGTIIEDNVEIGANTYITKGALSNTHIKRNAKIGLSCCIGHNVIIGENTIVLANSLVGGSTVVGKDVFIGVMSVTRDGLIIGDGATIGMGAVVTKSVEAKATMVGNPAKTVQKKSQ